MKFTADWLQGAGSLVGGLATIYAARESAKEVKNRNDLYEEERQRNIKKEDTAQMNLNAATSSVYGYNKKKEDPYKIKMV